MFSDSATRVEHHTRHSINRWIDQQTLESIEYYRGQRPEAITRRLQELDAEWDAERTLQANFAVLSSLGNMLTARAHRGWAVLALGAPIFMVQHALQGWCPPLALFRRQGVRTAQEINEERFALKTLRGDFDSLGDAPDAKEILRAVRHRWIHH